MTTNRAPRREKLGTPVGETTRVKLPEKYKKQANVERMDDNNRVVNESGLTGKAEYIVKADSNSPKKYRK